MAGETEGDVKLLMLDTMPLVAYLRCAAFDVMDVKVDGRRCFWVFESTDGIKSAIADFETEQTLVEPKQFSRMFQKVSAERNAKIKPR